MKQTQLRIVLLVVALLLLRPLLLVSQAIRFYNGDIRVPLMVGKTRNEVESILKRPVQEQKSGTQETCVYDAVKYSVRVRYENGIAVFVENPDYGDD